MTTLTFAEPSRCISYSLSYLSPFPAWLLTEMLERKPKANDNWLMSRMETGQVQGNLKAGQHPHPPKSSWWRQAKTGSSLDLSLLFLKNKGARLNSIEKCALSTYDSPGSRDQNGVICGSCPRGAFCSAGQKTKKLQPIPCKRYGIQWGLSGIDEQLIISSWVRHRETP